MSGKERGCKGKNVVGSPSPDVFISYQWDSKSEVLKLKKELEKNKISCWMDVRQIYGGAFLNQEIAEGIKNAKVMISCLTNAYTRSKNCYREVAYADQQKKPIIPIFLEEISSSPTGISEILAPLVYINFYGSDRKFEDILRSIRAILEKCTNSVDGPTGNGNKKRLHSKDEPRCSKKSNRTKNQSAFEDEPSCSKKSNRNKRRSQSKDEASCSKKRARKNTMTLDQLRNNIYDHICQKLNVPNPDKDYRALAGKMGYAKEKVDKFNLENDHARALLNDWGTKAENNVEKLIQILSELGRDDIVQILESF